MKTTRCSTPPFHSTEVSRSNLDSYRCFFALDSSQAVSISHDSDAVFATLAPTVIPQGNTGMEKWGGGNRKVVYLRFKIKLSCNWMRMWLWQNGATASKEQTGKLPRSLKPQTAWSLHEGFSITEQSRVFDGLLADTNSFICGWRFRKIQSDSSPFRSSKITNSKVSLRQTLGKVELSPLSQLFRQIFDLTFSPKPFYLHLSDRQHFGFRHSQTIWSFNLLKGLRQAVFHINHPELLLHQDFFCLRSWTTQPLTEGRTVQHRCGQRCECSWGTTGTLWTFVLSLTW